MSLRHYPAEILDNDEIARLIKAPNPKCPTGCRNRALVILLYRSGLRVSEALALKPSDLDPNAGTIRVLHGKGDKARTAGMDPEAFVYVQHWISERAKLGHDGRKPLFCTIKGEPMMDRYVRAMMKRLANRAKIDKRVHAHGLRHLLAVEMAREGLSLTTIQSQLGHSAASTTATYLRRISPQEAIDAVRCRTWGESPKDDSLFARLAAIEAELRNLQRVAVR
jgi:site-specific recombinase XerD